MPLILKGRILWSGLQNSSACFSAKFCLEALRSKAPQVGWYQLVWHKRHVPRWSLNQWVNRLLSWGIVQDNSRVLCAGGGIESHPHLHFSCQFSSLVWLGVGAKLGSYFHDWSFVSEVYWGSNLCKNMSVRASLFKLCLAASIYYIWKGKNGPTYERTWHDLGSVTHQILEEVKVCASSWRNVAKAG